MLQSFFQQMYNNSFGRRGPFYDSMINLYICNKSSVIQNYVRDKIKEKKINKLFINLLENVDICSMNHGKDWKNNYFLLFTDMSTPCPQTLAKK